jgi:hypothetical protein
LLIGAHALAVHGRPRATLDLDVFVEPSVGNARRVGAALADFGFAATAAQWRHLADPDRMMRLGREPLQIDILNEISTKERLFQLDAPVGARAVVLRRRDQR